MSLLPTGFSFSQSNLQDYVDCQRRFYLRHVERLAWPALISEPALESERRMRQGSEFHRLVHQHILGIPTERLITIAQGRDPQLVQWLQNFLVRFSPVTGENPWGVGRPVDLNPEITISAWLGEYRLVAKFDLLVVGADGRMLIVDWKTSARQPKRQHLANRLQTRLYPYSLVRAGAKFIQNNLRIDGRPDHSSSLDRSANEQFPVLPERIEMLYWYAEFPDQPIIFKYQEAQFVADGQYLQTLIDQIANSQEDDFDLTSDEKKCAYCVYRSLCNRGVEAGDLADGLESGEAEQEDEPFFFDFDQISEIAF
jgi:CRISPR/Cas system-associated exonuclease Cas4 (RecB family)